MEYTANYGLRKPGYTDPIEVADLNYNVEVIDGKLKESAELISTIEAEKADLADVQAMTLIFTDKTVTTEEWTEDTTYEDYPHKAVITCTGVTAAHRGDIVFAVEDAVSGIFAPVCLTATDTVTIYASEVPAGAITIPTISCVKAVS